MTAVLCVLPFVFDVFRTYFYMSSIYVSVNCRMSTRSVTIATTHVASKCHQLGMAGNDIAVLFDVNGSAAINQVWLYAFSYLCLLLFRPCLMSKIKAKNCLNQIIVAVSTPLRYIFSGFRIEIPLFSIFSVYPLYPFLFTRCILFFWNYPFLYRLLLKTLFFGNFPFQLLL